MEMNASWTPAADRLPHSVTIAVAGAVALHGGRLAHARGGSLFLSDEFPEYEDHGGVRAPSPEQPAAVAVVIHFGTPAEVDATFRRAVEAGCKAKVEPQDMFWDARFAMLNDPFGHRWMLNAPLPKKK